MAVRKNLFHDARTREKIQTSQLVNRLMSYINGEIELDSGKVRAIEILLKKSLPDLQSVAIDQKIDAKLEFSWQES